ncbi:murein biosynthesis integral membrane protein MurJ [Merismopedia glauca]|uniref:Probable lipid II flippase MurJ n=1 Tax=Merismopedia glauca CCAP 1448/3 TaxID=1296344 RepID=A0A2T1C0Y5_9CYAN|nr:murein biosynthesis integral membrane protein MurJ [Merismopedia glauca]PSB01827.1 murein biosynthesis integral membrane protein MurJ [Merismopedia glauca CCAP 1448/3]
MSQNQKQKTGRSLAGIAGIVAIATLISKLFGLIRQQAIAAAFGVGVVADAYNYAYAIPGFFLILLGGINGPFHSAIVSVLAKKPKSEAAPLVETVTTLVGGILLVLTAVLILLAGPFMDLIYPDLSPQVKSLAIQQLQIMAPMALLAGLIGVGFGTLNAADMYWLPSVSPLFSSITVIIGLGILALQLGKQVTTPEYAILGAQVLAWGTLSGAILQWLVQVIAQWRAGMGTLRLRFDLSRPGVKEVMQVMGPATLSSGMLQINLQTALFFASAIPSAAAALNYTVLLVQTPLGIISNMILVPFLPVFSKLAAPENWSDLKIRIRQGMILTAISMLPLSAIMVTLAFPIVRLVYERHAFNREASQLVASVLIASSSGMFFYLGRDVLVRVFYALGDGETPFRISIINIFLNAILDYLFVGIGPFGAPGLALATVVVNFTSMVALLWLLDRKLKGLNWQEWVIPILGLVASSVEAGGISWVVTQIYQQFLPTKTLFSQLCQLGLAAGAGLAVFFVLTSWLNIPEFEMFTAKIRQKFVK